MYTIGETCYIVESTLPDVKNIISFNISDIKTFSGTRIDSVDFDKDFISLEEEVKVILSNKEGLELDLSCKRCCYKIFKTKREATLFVKRYKQ
ncbi:MAG: hypothetical protein HOG49_00075 [Candidatus Scalindua sp.]|jgi:hypothetical protein|nr:hypothetical protein [Candidatus Scalindua sp.]